MKSTILLLSALLMTSNAPAAAKPCAIKASDYVTESADLKNVIGPDNKFYEVRGLNVSKTEALLITYGSVVDAQYDYFKTKCPVPVSVSKLISYSNLPVITSAGTLNQADVVVLKDKTKASYKGSTSDGRIVLNVLGIDHTLQYREIHKPLIVNNSDLERKLEIPAHYYSCDIKVMKSDLTDATKSRIFYGTNTDELLKKCQKSGYQNCRSGEFAKYGKTLDANYYALCVQMMPKNRISECNPIQAKESLGHAGVIGIKFNLEKLLKAQPQYCEVLATCQDSTNISEEIEALAEIQSITGC